LKNYLHKKTTYIEKSFTLKKLLSLKKLLALKKKSLKNYFTYKMLHLKLFLTLDVN
jgi:hypothetical protein